MGDEKGGRKVQPGVWDESLDLLKRPPEDAT